MERYSTQGGDVCQREEVLDAGCGTGAYTDWLLERGARVTGVDGNANMLRHAASRVGDRARLIRANLEEPLSMFADGLFDGIVRALTVTYLRDLNPVFREFARILTPKGWFVFSTEHPFFSYRYHSGK
jgi:predicted TPR repeat methyltransferase